MGKFINITKTVLLGKDGESKLFVVAIAVIALKSDSGIGQKIQNLFTNTGAKIESAGSTVGGNTPANP